ncbi:MAG: glycoside hydrolase family 31 protein [Promethearchaeota archaeon]
MIKNAFSTNIFDSPDLVVFLAEAISDWEFTPRGLSTVLEGRFFVPEWKYEIANEYARFVTVDPAKLREKCLVDDPDRVGRVHLELEFVNANVIRFKIMSGLVRDAAFKVLDVPTLISNRDSVQIVLNHGSGGTDAAKNGAQSKRDDDDDLIIHTKEIDEPNGFSRMIVFETGAIHVEIVDFPFSLRIFNRESSEVACELLEHYESIMSLGVHLPIGFAFSKSMDRHVSLLSNVLHRDEHVYGLGEDFGSLDKRGRAIVLETCDATSSDTDYMYKPIPFFVSTRNYGWFVNRSEPMRFSVGKDYYHTLSLQLISDYLDVYCIIGNSMKDVIKHYTSLTGCSPMPPKWSFGFWISRISYHSRDEVISIAKEFRRCNIPCDVIHIDTDWFEKEWQCDWRFDESRWPDPAGMCNALHEMGFHVSLWQLPCIVPGNPLYDEALQLKFFHEIVDDADDGTVYSKGLDGRTGIIDLTNPAAVEWYEGKLRALLEMGIDVIKVDFGESIPLDSRFNKYPGVVMHNLYPLLYNKICFELASAVKGSGSAVIWARSAWAGSQRYPVHWSGDPKSRFHAMYHTLRGGLSLGFCGFTFWSHDIGGFAGRPESELYARWAQFGFLTSHSRAHGTPPREPWEYDDLCCSMFMKYLKLKYRLMPYIYSQAYYSSRAGMPLLRAMILEFEEDPNCATLDDQYMFGDSILVAPVFEHDARSRMVYLPAGRWIDFWTEAPHDGPAWIQRDAPLDVLPLFIRMGSIIPMTTVIPYLSSGPFNPVELHVYGIDLTGTDALEFRYFDAGSENVVQITHDPLNGKLKVKPIKVVDQGIDFIAINHPA